MKNLKKVLAFVLVVAMMASLVISASALSAKDFTDYSEIVNKDAVAMLTELKVINGYPTGDYQPSKVVTRAEMAKMIYTALMGGNDSAPVQTTNKYSDVWSGMWCEGYVAFCDELGIIAGYGDGTFGPNDTVTAVQAAKMLLVAMGYDAAKEGFVADPQWSYNILKVASAKGLFEGFNADTAAGCTRDNAALLIYNALKAETVTYVGTSAVDNGETLLGNIFGLEAVTGVVVANEYANLFGAEPLRAGYTEIALLGTHYIEQDQAIDPDFVVTNVKEAADYVLTFIGEFFPGVDLLKDSKFDTSNRTEIYDEKPGTSWLVEFNRREAVGAWDEYNTLIFKTSTDLATVGETITVYAKVDANGDYTEAVVGNVVVDDDCVVATYDGVDYEDILVKTDKNTRYFVNYAMAWDTKGEPSRYWMDFDRDGYAVYNDNGAISYNLPGETTKCVDVDGDGIVELVLKTRPVFTQANYDKYYDSWYFDGYYYEDGQYKYDGIFNSSIVTENGFEDEDYVLVTYIDGTYYVEKAATVEGMVEKVSYTEEDYPYVVLEDGTKLDESGLYWVANCPGCKDVSAEGHTHFDRDTLYSYIADCGFNAEYVFFLDEQGNVVAYAPKEMPRKQDRVALMTGSYIEGTSFEYALTFENEEGVTIYNVDTNKFGDVEGDDCDFFIEKGLEEMDVNSGVLIGGTMFYKLSGYDTRVANHMAFIKSLGEKTSPFYDHNLNIGIYGDGKETALVAVSERGETVSAYSVLTDNNGFVKLTDRNIKAGQYKFSSYDGKTVYAGKDTVFFVYEKVLCEARGGRQYYEVNVYSFSGYQNLPQYAGGAILNKDGDMVSFDGLTCGYALISETYAASYVVLEVSTDGRNYADDMALVLEKVKETNDGFVTYRYLNADGEFKYGNFCSEDSYTNVYMGNKVAKDYGTIYVGKVYAIADCDHGKALIDEDDVLGYKNGNMGWLTGSVIFTSGPNAEYVEKDGVKYDVAEDVGYYGIINLTTNDGRTTKVTIVKFDTFADFRKYTDDNVGMLWTAETNKKEAYNQINAMIAVVDLDVVGKDYVGLTYGQIAAHFVSDGPVEEIISTEVVAPVVITEEEEAAPAPAEDQAPPQA